MTPLSIFKAIDDQGRGMEALADSALYHCKRGGGGIYKYMYTFRYLYEGIYFVM